MATAPSFEPILPDGGKLKVSSEATCDACGKRIVRDLPIRRYEVTVEVDAVDTITIQALALAKDDDKMLTPIFDALQQRKLLLCPKCMKDYTRAKKGTKK